MRSWRSHGLAFSLLPILGCEREPLQAPKILSKDLLDARLLAKHQQDPEKVWSLASEQELWSAIQHGDGMISVHWTGEQDELDQLTAQGTLEIITRYPKLQALDLQVADYATFAQLRHMTGISRIEPAGYQEPSTDAHYSSGSGLGCDAAPNHIHSEDHRWIAPGARLSWNFDAHKIQQAWAYANGKGVTVGLIDTGTSDHQVAFSPQVWSSGWSNDRFIDRQGMYVDSIWRWKKKVDGPHDRCGHGSFMSSVLAAPRNDRGQPTGVAYGANLVVVRAAKDVFLDAYHEKRGVARAITALADRSDVKVISMSMGYIFHVGVIADAVRYAHRKGKMIVTAAGTSFKATNGVGVVFPARMNETVAVTGLLDTSYIKACVECHYGPQVDFSMVVQREGDANRRSVVLGYRTGELAYTGGSSAATAMFSGIAALVWSKHPNWSRAQVRAQLEKSSDLYPHKDENYGYGRVNALKALQ